MIVLTMGLVAEARLDKTSWSCEQAMSCCTALQHTVTVPVIWCTAQCCLKGIAFCAGKGCLTTRLPSHVLSSCLPLHAEFFLRSFGADYWLQGLFGFRALEKSACARTSTSCNSLQVCSQSSLLRDEMTMIIVTTL